jgi:transposase
MKSMDLFNKLFLHRDPVDFRKSFNGLTAIVQEEMNLNIFESALFIFCCKRRKRVKILYWDKSGFAIWYKKLEEDLFPWPRKLDKIVEITSEQMAWVLEGIDVWKIKRHEEKKYEKTC